MRNGHYKDGAIDLALEIFGFVTAGLGATAKLGKAVTNAGSTLGALARGGKILGVTALNAFNPLSGSVDLAVGAGRLVTDGISASAQGIRKLRGTANGQVAGHRQPTLRGRRNRRFTGGYAASGRLGHTPTR